MLKLKRHRSPETCHPSVELDGDNSNKETENLDICCRYTSGIRLKKQSEALTVTGSITENTGDWARTGEGCRFKSSLIHEAQWVLSGLLFSVSLTYKKGLL